MEAYPVHKMERRERFGEGMAGLRDYSAEELDGELLDLHATQMSLEGNELMTSANCFLKDLRLKVKELKD